MNRPLDHFDGTDAPSCQRCGTTTRPLDDLELCAACVESLLEEAAERRDECPAIIDLDAQAEAARQASPLFRLAVGLMKGSCPMSAPAKFAVGDRVWFAPPDEYEVRLTTIAHVHDLLANFDDGSVSSWYYTLTLPWGHDNMPIKTGDYLYAYPAGRQRLIDDLHFRVEGLKDAIDKLSEETS